MKSCRVIFDSLSNNWFTNQFCAPSKNQQNIPWSTIQNCYVNEIVHRETSIHSFSSILFDLRAGHFLSQNSFANFSEFGPKNRLAYQILYKRAKRLRFLLFMARIDW